MFICAIFWLMAFENSDPELSKSIHVRFSFNFMILIPYLFPEKAWRVDVLSCLLDISHYQISQSTYSNLYLVMNSQSMFDQVA